MKKFLLFAFYIVSADLWKMFDKFDHILKMSIKKLICTLGHLHDRISLMVVHKIKHLLKQKQINCPLKVLNSRFIKIFYNRYFRHPELISGTTTSKSESVITITPNIMIKNALELINSFTLFYTLFIVEDGHLPKTTLAPFFFKA